MFGGINWLKYSTMALNNKRGNWIYSTGLRIQDECLWSNDTQNCIVQYANIANMEAKKPSSGNTFIATVQFLRDVTLDFDGVV